MISLLSSTGQETNNANTEAIPESPHSHSWPKLPPQTLGVFPASWYISSKGPSGVLPEGEIRKHQSELTWEGIFLSSTPHYPA